MEATWFEEFKAFKVVARQVLSLRGKITLKISKTVLGFKKFLLDRYHVSN